MIHILTPCSRPMNLVMIAPSIPPKCSWKVAFDKSTGVQSRGKWYTSEYTGHWGHPIRNEMLSRLKAKPDDYILFLDDDNLIHPNWYEHIKGSTADMVTWGQENKDGSVRLRATSEPKVGNIDMGSFMVKYKIAKQLKFTNLYEADGIFAMEAAKTASDIQVINESISYYNYLK